MVINIKVMHEIHIKDLELIVAAFGINPSEIADATERLRASSAALAASVEAAGGGASTSNP